MTAQHLNRLLRAMLCFLAAFAVGKPAAAECQGEPIALNTRLDAGSLEALSNKCLGNQVLAEALTEQQVWAIRTYKSHMNLIPTAPLPSPYRVLQASERYAETATLNPDTLALENYQAGVPFTTISTDDPLAGVKVIWNHIYGQPHSDQFGLRGGSVSPNFVYTLIDGTKGIERIQEWQFSRYYLRGRTEGTPTIGDGTIMHKSVLFAVYPHDIKGLGTFTISYHTPQVNDTWAYVRSVRRVRRLSGGAWVDPVGGTDQLQDDIWWNAHPSWYVSIKLLGKRWVMHPSDSQRGKPEAERPSWYPQKPTLPEQFPRLVFEPPYWNMDDVWMPREVYVIEGIPPEFHPYGRRLVYVDIENNNYLFSEVWDKRGEFWKSVVYATRPYPADDGFIDPRTGKPELYWFTAWGQITDFQRRHSTNIHISDDFYLAAGGTAETDFTLARLESAGR